MKLTKKIDIFGQETILELLEKRTRDFIVGYRRNLALIGSEFCGKTTLIKHWLQRMYDPKLVPIYITINTSTFKQFINNTIKAILIAVLKRSGKISPYSSLSELKPLINSFNPKIAEKCNYIINLSIRKKNLDSFKELILLLDIISIELGISIVFIIEEFHNLNNFRIKNLFKEWGKILCLQKNVLYLISSSSAFKSKHILDNDLRLLFGNFEIVKLEHLDYNNGSKFIKIILISYLILQTAVSVILELSANR